MGVESMSIVLPSPIFYSGQLLTGTVTLNISNTVQASSIEMKLEGIARVSWSERRQRTVPAGQGKTRTESYTEVHSASINLITFHRDIMIQGGVLHPGTHQLPFAFELPINLTSSFEGQHGSVRYWIRVKKPHSGIIGTIMASLQEQLYHVKILQPVDTNYPGYLFPVGAKDSKTICCCCCATGPLTIDVKTDRAAYCPGETVLLSGIFENKSTRKVTPYVKLIQHQRFRAQLSHKLDIKTWDLQQVGGNGEATRSLTEGDSSDWQNIGFLIPACYPSIKLDIIEVSYFLQVAMRVPGTTDLNITLPIVIATIPYRGPPQVVVTNQVVGRTDIGWSGGKTGSVLPPPPVTAADASVKVEAPAPAGFGTVFTQDAAKAETEEKADKK